MDAQPKFDFIPGEPVSGPKFDFIPETKPLTLGESAKHAAQDFTGAAFVAADWFKDGLELILKGLGATAKGIGSVAKGYFDPREEVTRQELIDWMESWRIASPSEMAKDLGVSEDWVEGWVKEGANEALHKGLEGTAEAGGVVTDVTGSPTTGAISKALLDIWLMKKAHDVASFPQRKIESVVMEKLDKRDANKVSEETYDAEAAKTDAMVDELTGRKSKYGVDPLADKVTPEGEVPFEMKVTPYESKPLEPTQGTVQPNERPLRLDQNTELFERPDYLAEGPQRFKPERAPRRGGPEITPEDLATKSEFQGARFDEGVTLGREGFTLEPMTLDPQIKNRWKGDEFVDTSRAKDTTLEMVQRSLDFDMDPIHEAGRLATMKEGFLRSAEELMQSKYFKKKEGIEEPTPKGRSGFGKNQRGSVDPSVFREGIEKIAKAAVKRFMSKGKVKSQSIVPGEFLEGGEALPKEVRDVLPDTRPLDKVIEELQQEKATTGVLKDIGKFMKNFLTESNLLTYYKDRPLIKNVIDRLNEIDNRWNRSNESLREGEVLGEADTAAGRTVASVLSPNLKKRLIRKEAGPLGYIDKLSKKEKVGFWKTVHEFDGSKVLYDMGLQWPTRKMLQDAGMSPTQIKAYELYARLTDNLYDIANYARKLDNPKLGNIRRIPGYFPHMYKGSWFFEVRDKKTGKPVFFTRTETRGQANRLWKELQKKAKTDPTAAQIMKDAYLVEPTRIENATEISSMTAAFEKTLEVLDNKHWANPYIKKMMNRVQSSVAAGVLPHTLERALNLRGYLGDTIMGEKNFAKQSREAFENYIHAVTEYAKKMEIQKFVWEPVQENRKIIKEDLGLPETYDYIERATNAYKGTPTNFFDTLDRAIEGFVDKIPGIGGGSGHPVRTALRKIRNFFTTKAIGYYNPVYLAGNVIQPHFMGIPVMVRESARLGKGNAWLEALKIDLNSLDVPGFRPSKEHYDLAVRASKEKVISPNLMENIDFSWTTNKVGAGEKAMKAFTGRYAAEHIESVGRLKSLLYAYEVYKSAGLTKEAAYQAAKRRVDEIMLNYDKIKRPRMYQDFGLAGEAISPFAVFAHGQLGNFFITLKAIKEHKGPVNKLAPVVTQQAVGLMAAGYMGVIAMAEVEMLFRGLNAALAAADVDLDFGSPTEWFLEMGVKMPDMIASQSAEDTIRYGLPSTMSRAIPHMEAGVNVGSLMKAPAANDLVSAAAVEWVWKSSMEAVPAIWRIINKNGTKNDFYVAINSLLVPNWLRGWTERMQAIEYGQFRVGTDQTTWEKLIPREGEPSSTEPGARFGGKGNASREAKDWKVRQYTGKRSLDEENQLEAARIIERDKRKQRVSASRLAQRAADYADADMPVPEKLYEDAIKLGILPHQFDLRIRQEQEDRLQGRTERAIGKTPSLQNIDRARRLKELGQ